MIWNAFIIALREIRRNLMRAFLTVLGIVIGVAAVITMVTLGRGATESVRQTFTSLGTNVLTLRPGQGFGGRSSSTPGVPGIPLFNEMDVRSISEQVPGVRSVAPVVNTQVPTIYRQRSRNTSIQGTTPEYFDIGNWKLADGRFFTHRDVRDGSAVCVIGQTVRRELFGDEDPIGQKLRLRDASFMVIGLLAPKGQGGFGNDQDDNIMAPMTALQRRLTGRTSVQSINTVMIAGEEDYPTTSIVADTTLLMRERRNLRENEENNFSVFDSRQLADALSSSTKVMTTLLGAVAGVSLLVGGIGIMNIMLVSVTERTREIGIRLAIGARAREVLMQFLVEAVTLSCAGGLTGMLLAYGLCHFLANVIGVAFIFDMNINIISFIFSAAIGILFGFMPARRAAALDPIEALRHE
ncbi:MAG TPA: ABC transporter permease [Verrucomicrobiales bacterium]|nr:ABC transporter permease [Verrucomicrobiales bacterium]